MIRFVLRIAVSNMVRTSIAFAPECRQRPLALGPVCELWSGRGGSIIFMGSVHSKEASMLKAPYVTAKHGLIGLAKVIAKERAAHGVRANVICPGFVRTPKSNS